MTLSLVGNHFVSTSVVQWNGTPLATTYVDGRGQMVDHDQDDCGGWVHLVDQVNRECESWLMAIVAIAFTVAPPTSTPPYRLRT